jgi:ribosomal protein S27AE
VSQAEKVRVACPSCGTVLISPTGRVSCSACQKILVVTAPGSSGKGPNLAGGCFGLFFGVGMAIWTIIGGIFLCATGVGAFFGIPLIIAGCFMPFLGALKGVTTLKGKCPWCGFTTIGSAPGFNCAACKNRIVVHGKTFAKAPR